MTYEKKPYKAGLGFKAQGSRFKKSEQKPVYKPRRGTLAPLMKEEEKEKAGIHELSYDFGSLLSTKNRQAFFEMIEI